MAWASVSEGICGSLACPMHLFSLARFSGGCPTLAWNLRCLRVDSKTSKAPMVRTLYRAVGGRGVEARSRMLEPGEVR